MVHKKSKHVPIGFMRGVLGATAWTAAVKGGRQLVSHLNKVTRLVYGSFSNGFVRVNCSFAFHLAAIWRTQGVPGIVKRLKVSQVLLMQALAGRKHRSAQSVGVAIARSSGGFPRLIPAIHRRRLLSGDVRIIRYWMTLLGLYRVLEMPGKVKINTITDPSTMKDWVRRDLACFREEFLRRAPFSFRSLADTVVKPLLLCTSSPNAMRQGTSLWSSISVARALFLNKDMENLVRSYIEAMGTKPTGKTTRAFLLNKKFIDEFVRLGKSAFAERCAESATSLVSFGSLAPKLEPAGKIRVFAMLDYLSQILLRPLHDELFNCLRKIPQDGLYDQHRPLRALSEKVHQGKIKYAKSIDLSAATDRFPILVQMDLLETLVSDKFALAWGCLLARPFYPNDALCKLLGASAYNPSGAILPICYAAGQPMGAYSSWAIFALCHHMVVQRAACRVGFRE